MTGDHRPTDPPRFTHDTAVSALGDGRYRADCSTQWAAPMGPNGGYLAAIVLRAMLVQLDDPARPARSLTLHYLRPPADGEAIVSVTVERSGRSLSTLTARLEQAGDVCIIAVGAFGAAFDTAADFAQPPPAVVAAAQIQPWPLHEALPPIAHRVHSRPAIGAPPFSGAAEAISGGWISLREPAPVDAVLLALLVDAWLPAVFGILTAPVGAPTIDLTVHFRNPAAAAAHPPQEPLLCVFSSTTSADGYFEEDGRIWTPGGVLLAQSRQLALLRPVARPDS